MDKQLFEELISPFTIKIVTTSESVLPAEYKPTFIITKKVYNRSGERVTETGSVYKKMKADSVRSKARRRVITPLGIFKSVVAAAEAYGVTRLNIANRIKKGEEGYHYEE